MKQGLRLCLVVLLIATAAAFWADYQVYRLKKNESILVNNPVIPAITEVPYHKDGIEAVYPKLLTGGTEEELERWNQLIYSDFEEILQIYSFHPFPGPTPSGGTATPTILKLGYEIKENTDQLLSIFYTAAYNARFSAHPTDLAYTTLIDKKKNSKLRLPDYLKVDEKFVENFRSWNFIPYDENNQELNQAIREYIAHLSDQDLLQGFQAADQIGSKNLYGVYSYITEDKVGISIEVPNFLGDHVEFEQDKNKLKEFFR